MLVLQTVIEFAVAALLIVGLFNEQKVVAFEDKIIAFIKRRFGHRTAPAAYRSRMPENDRRHCA